MRTLVIDTATDQGLVAIGDNSKVLGSTSWRSNARHGENIIGRIDHVLEQTRTDRQDIDLIGVCVGPGGFTRVRVGLATAKGLSLALNVPIVGVSSLRVMARGVTGHKLGVRVPVINAYRGEIYAAGYQWREGKLVEVAPPSHGPLEVVLDRIKESIGENQNLIRVDEIGPGHDQVLVEEVFFELEDNGAADLATLEPTYLRPSDAKLPAAP